MRTSLTAVQSIRGTLEPESVVLDVQTQENVALTKKKKKRYLFLLMQ